MLRWLGRTLSSSIGKKYIMALTGLALIGFLFVHLAGNLLLYSGQNGEAFEAYGKKLEENPLLPFAEIGLLLLFVVHIYYAFRLSAENREARRERYVVRASRGAQTLASASMLVTGLGVLIFLIIHVYDFRIGKMFSEAPASEWKMVRTRLHQPLAAAIYVAGVTALGIHLQHAFRSAFQTLGVSHPRFNYLLVKLGWAVAIVLGVGFVSFPIYFLWTGDSR